MEQRKIHIICLHLQREGNKETHAPNHGRARVNPGRRLFVTRMDSRCCIPRKASDGVNEFSLPVDGEESYLPSSASEADKRPLIQALIPRLQLGRIQSPGEKLGFNGSCRFVVW